jgi:hypothetical protein
LTGGSEIGTTIEWYDFFLHNTVAALSDRVRRAPGRGRDLRALGRPDRA